MKTVSERQIREATIRFLKRSKLADIVDEDYEGLVIAYLEDDDVLAFVKPCVSGGTYHDSDAGIMSNEDFDKLVCKYFIENPGEREANIRYDACNFLVVSEGRAILQYRTNALEF